MNYRALSLFSSAGIAETYFDAHGVSVKVAAELLPERVKIYRQLYPSVHMIEGDITEKKIFDTISEEAKCAK